MIKITVYRHGQTNWNKKGLMQGHSDIPLNLVGLAQAFELGKKLENEKIDLILASDLSRANQTARVATKKHSADIPFVISPKLRETCFGDYEGITREEFYSSDLSKILDNPNHSETFTARIPGGESHGEVIARFLQCLEDNINNYPFARNVAIFAHYGIMRIITKYLTKEMRTFDNCEGLEFYYDLSERKLKI